MEVDLAALELALAVEIDGYYHFRDADAYRRDRRKDFELQKRGFLVVRVLADDVVRPARRRFSTRSWPRVASRAQRITLEGA